MWLYNKKTNRKHSLILLTVIGVLLISAYLFLGLPAKPEPLDPWEASVDKVRPWSEKNYNAIIHAPTYTATKVNLSSSTRIVKKTATNIEVEYRSRPTSELPSKIVTLEHDKLFNNIIVSNLLQYDEAGNHKVETQGTSAFVASELAKPVYDYLYWNTKLAKGKIKMKSDVEYTGLPRIAGLLSSAFKDNTVSNWRIFDKRTHVEIAASSGLATEVSMLHPAPVIMAVDVIDKVNLSAELDPSGVVSDIGDFQCRVIADFKNQSASGGGSSYSAGRGSVEFDYWKEEGLNLCHYVVEWSDLIPIKHSWLEIETNSGGVVKSSKKSVRDRFVSYEIAVDPSQIKKVSIHSKPYFTRYITELDELPNMYEPNRGVSNLFEIKIPNYAQSPTFPNLQYRLATLTQLKPYGYSSSSSMGPKVVIKNYGEVTVREMIEEWENLAPDNWFQVTKSTMNYNFHEEKPAARTNGQKLMEWWDER